MFIILLEHPFLEEIAWVSKFLYNLPGLWTVQRKLVEPTIRTDLQRLKRDADTGKSTAINKTAVIGGVLPTGGGFWD